MTELQEKINELDSMGVTLAAVSVDTPEVSIKFARDAGLTFALLSDADREVVAQWSLLNKRERGGIAFPAVFILDRTGTIIFRSLDRMASRVDPSALLSFLSGWREDPTSQCENATRTLTRPSIWDTLASAHRKYLGAR